MDICSHRTIGASVPASRARDEEKKAKQRRLQLLRRRGLFGELPKGVEIALLINPAEANPGDLSAARQLVFDTFSDLGYIDPCASWLRPHDSHPSTATFVAKSNGTVVGTQSLVVDGLDLGLPSDGAFKVELDRLRGTGRKLFEVTRQAIAQGYQGTSVTTALMQCTFSYARKMGCTDLIATVSPPHESFYKLLYFETIGGERSYSTKIYDPVVSMWLDIVSVRAAIRAVADDGDEAGVFIGRFFYEDNPWG